MESRIQEVVEELEGQFAEFRLSEALMTTYRLVWDDFCSWYLELIKPPYGEPIDRKTMDTTVSIFEDLLKLLHPFMPFLTEEIWHWIRERSNPNEAICHAAWPAQKAKNTDLLQEFVPFQQAVSEIRTIRKNNQIPQREALALNIQEGADYPLALESALIKLTNLSGVQRVDSKVPNAFGFVVGTTSFFVPFGAAVDVDAEKAKIQKELDHLSGFLKSVRGKLSNERFVQNAPDNVVALERKKESDALAKLEVLQTKLAELG
jgi:valyl-tRNA synthetase